MLDKTGRGQRGRFSKGRSGNLAGRPKGSRNLTTRAIEALLDGEGEDIMRKAIELAKGGDGLALRACLVRLLPPRRDRPVAFEMPRFETLADLPKASGALLAAVAAGELTPSEAIEFSKLIDAHVRAIEATDIDERLAKLEANLE
ncbi:hypothetical protein SAMN05444161_1476 [Rhizobiales bacterium GAS191]|nr:hypothetical protein SAMN05444161_1476 [Rhizobiales bacterium GAS191]